MLDSLNGKMLLLLFGRMKSEIIRTHVVSGRREAAELQR